MLYMIHVYCWIGFCYMYRVVTKIGKVYDASTCVHELYKVVWFNISGCVRSTHIGYNPVENMHT